MYTTSFMSEQPRHVPESETTKVEQKLGRQTRFAQCFPDTTHIPFFILAEFGEVAADQPKNFYQELVDTLQTALKPEEFQLVQDCLLYLVAEGNSRPGNSKKYLHHLITAQLAELSGNNNSLLYVLERKIARILVGYYYLNFNRE